MGDSASKGGSVLLERPESVLSPPDFEPLCIWKATKRKKEEFDSENSTKKNKNHLTYYILSKLQGLGFGQYHFHKERKKN